MKKLGLILASMLMAGSMTIRSAESGEKTQKIIEVSPMFGLAEGSKVGFQVDFNMLFPVAKNVLWGAGVGFQTSSFDFDYLAIPIYTRGKAYFNDKSNSMRPFVQLDFGYNLPLQGGLDNGSLIIAPSVGVDFGTVNVGFGYRRDQSVKASGGADGLFLTIGAKISGNANFIRNSKFLKRTNLTIEGIGSVPFVNCTNVSQLGEGKFAYEEEYNKKFIAGGKIAWTYRFTDNFSAGIGTGFYFISRDAKMVNSSSSASSENLGVLPLFLRGNYKIKDIQFGKFIPYVNLDLGMLRSTKQYGDKTKYFMADPTVGVSLPVTERQSLNIGVGLNTAFGSESKSDSNLSSSLGNGFVGFGISIGYTL